MIATIPEAIFTIAVIAMAACAVSLIPTLLHAAFGVQLCWPKRGNTRNAPAPPAEPAASSASKLHTLHWKNGERWGTIPQQTIPTENATR